VFKNLKWFSYSHLKEIIETNSKLLATFFIISKHNLYWILKYFQFFKWAGFFCLDGKQNFSHSKICFVFIVWRAKVLFAIACNLGNYVAGGNSRKRNIIFIFTMFKIWEKAKHSKSALSNLVAIRHMWRQAL